LTVVLSRSIVSATYPMLDTRHAQKNLLQPVLSYANCIEKIGVEDCEFVYSEAAMHLCDVTNT